MSELPQVTANARSTFVSPNASILEAITILNEAHLRIALVVEEGRLLGVVADANVRRAILNKIDFTRPVREIMVRDPIVVEAGTPDAKIRELMERTMIYEVPVIDLKGRVVDLKTLGELKPDGGAEERIAVIMAGGLGERLHPVTKETPKPLLTVGDKPILFTVMDQLIAAGSTRIWLAVNYKADMVRDAVSAMPGYADIAGFLEEDAPLGTAGALSLLPRRPTDAFFVMNGDLLTKVALDEMYHFHHLERNLVTMALKSVRFEIPYGCARVEGTRVIALEEKPSQTAFVNAGVYVVSPDVLDLVPESRLYNMTDLIAYVIAREGRVGSFPVHEYWIDIGFPEQLERAHRDFRVHFEHSGKGAA
jgi:dTDP-glucose pyrophosphorylase